MARYLVTGADGCLGAWVTRILLDRGDEVTAFDVGANDSRHRLIAGLGAAGGTFRPDGFRRITGDIRDGAEVHAACEGIDRIIHLAALQVPACRADPTTGAAINVGGTVNVFEAARSHGIASVTYASSIAVFGTADDYAQPILPADEPVAPRTHYGAYKVANEHTAAAYAAEGGPASAGLRPHTVYGAGRDQGMTSKPTVAIAHAVCGRAYHVDYGGALDFQYAPDVAAQFIAAADLPTGQNPPQALVLNLSGHVMGVADFVGRVRAVLGFDDLGASGESLPLPNGIEPGDTAKVLGDFTPTAVDEAITETARLLRAAEYDPLG